MNQKLKTEVYQGLQGINIKFSPYITGPLEFLNIVNMDFQQAGSLTQRWGSTMYFGHTLGIKISTLTEFSRITGESYVIYGGVSALFSGNSFISTQGISFINFPHTANPDVSTSMYSIEAIAPGPTTQFFTAGVPYLGDYRKLVGSFYTRIPGQTLDSSYLSTTAQNNFLFAANGQQFFRFDGVTARFIGLPPVNVVGVTTRILPAVGTTTIGMGVTGSYVYYGSFVNDRGLEGQIWPIASVTATKYDALTLGGTFYGTDVNVLIPNGYGIQSLNLYSYWSSASLSINATTTWTATPYNYLTNWPLSGGGLTVISGSTYMKISLGTTVGSQTNIIGNAGILPDPVFNSYYPLGFTAVIGSTSNGANYIGTFTINDFYPQYLETYQNRLFVGGFSLQPSLVNYSDVGEPEGFPLENSFEVRTNDADVLTGMKAYMNRMYFFKRKSFHVLIGDNSTNFSLSQVSAQYGAINNRCIITFGEDEVLAFLDRKGIIFYNGAKPMHASVKVQPYFDRMNYSAAMTEACMVHDKLRNQIICAIPIDSSSINNIQIIFDYVANAWTTSQGLAASSLARIQGRNATENAFFGSYSGIICWYGPTLMKDASIDAAGVGFTVYMKPKFNHEMGDSITKQFRRLFMNQTPVGNTRIFNVNFFQDYGTSTVLSTTLVMSEFQERLEFGIPAKSLTYEMYSAADATYPIQITGYTIEERLQRKV